MSDRLIDVGDLVVAAVKAQWQPAEPNEISREYVVEADINTITGRKVYVFCLADGEAERLDRATVLWEYRFSIVTVERFEDAGLPPKAWMDARLEFCRTKIYDTLNISRKANYLGNPATLYTQTIERPAYDFDTCRDSSCFRCEMPVALREMIAG